MNKETKEKLLMIEMRHETIRAKLTRYGLAMVNYLDNGEDRYLYLTDAFGDPQFYQSTGNIFDLIAYDKDGDALGFAVDSFEGIGLSDYDRIIADLDRHNDRHRVLALLIALVRCPGDAKYDLIRWNKGKTPERFDIPSAYLRGEGD